MYKYILIKEVVLNNYALIDREHYQIIRYNTLYHTIEDSTKSILSHYNKVDTIGKTYFQIFVDGKYKGLSSNLVIQTNDETELELPFSLENFRSIITEQYKKKYKIEYDPNRDGHFVFHKKGGER